MLSTAIRARYFMYSFIAKSNCAIATFKNELMKSVRFEMKLTVFN